MAGVQTKIGFTESGGNLKATLRRVASNVQPFMVAAQEIQIEELKKRAIEMSSHTGYKIGRDKGYPYAHSPVVPMPQGPQFANKQTSGPESLSESWKTNTSLSGEAITSTLYNTSPEARFFAGYPTERMVARPLIQHLVYDLEGRMEVEYRKKWFAIWENK